MKVEVLHNQTLLDISVQTTGIAENWFKIAKANNLVPTAPIAPGTILTIPDTIEIEDEIVKYYTDNNILPATEATTELQIIELTCEEKLYECFKN